MSVIMVIARTEFKRMFSSPLAWSLLAMMQFILAWIFLLGLSEYLERVQPQVAMMDNAPGITDLVISSLYLWAGLLMLAMMPLLTMRLLAEERMKQTLVLLTTAPVSVSQIVLGKYLGLLFLIVIMVAMLTLMPLSLMLGTSLDWGKLSAAVLGLFLLLASFAAAGLFLSSLTRQPIIAAISTFGLLIFLMVLYISGNSQGSASGLFIYLSHFGHFLSFLDGVFDTADLAYYLLFITGFLLLAIRKLDNDRLKG